MGGSEFSLSCRGFTSSQLREALSHGPAADALAAGDLSLEVRPAPHDTRSLDPTVLVALAGGLSTVLSVVITGLFQLAKKEGKGTIVVLTRDGTRLEAPSGTTQEELDLFISKARQLDVAHIHVSGEA